MDVPQKPIEVPREALNDDTLRAVVESFILREGTDYGLQEVTFDTKIQQVLRQLDKGLVRIVFDPNTETVTLMTEHEWVQINTQK